MVAATVLGALLAVGRLSDHAWVRVPVTAVIEFFRAVPLLILILFCLLYLPTVGIADRPVRRAGPRPDAVQHGRPGRDLPGRHPLGRPRAARGVFALGMRKYQVMTLVLLPQAVRRMLPVLIAQLVVLLKDSSLGFIVGYFELLRQARSLVEFFNSKFGDLYTFQLYVAAAVIYIVVNLLLSALARYVERRTRRNTKTAGHGRGGAARRRADGRRRRAPSPSDPRVPATARRARHAVPARRDWRHHGDDARRRAAHPAPRAPRAAAAVDTASPTPPPSDLSPEPSLPSRRSSRRRDPSGLPSRTPLSSSSPGCARRPPTSPRPPAPSPRWSGRRSAGPPPPLPLPGRPALRRRHRGRRDLPRAGRRARLARPGTASTGRSGAGSARAAAGRRLAGRRPGRPGRGGRRREPPGSPRG